MDQDFPDNIATSYFNSAKKRKANSTLNGAINDTDDHCNVDLNNNTIPFGSTNLPQNNSSFGDHHNHQAQQPTALKKDFLFLSSDWDLYHMDHLPNLPYFSSSSSKQNNNVVYHPLKNNVLINTKSYAEITFRTDNFFLGDDQGQYEKTVEATAIDFLMHCKEERRLYVARSIVIPEKEVYTRIFFS